MFSEAGKGWCRHLAMVIINSPEILRADSLVFNDTFALGTYVA